MKKHFIIVALFLLPALILITNGCVSTSPTVAETDIPIVRGDNLEDKLDWIEGNASGGDTYIIELSSDENILPRMLDYGYRGLDDITILLRGKNNNHAVSLSADGAMFTIFPGITLVLDDRITLHGRSQNKYPLIYINGGTLVMNADSSITGNSTNGFGGGVYIKENGTFTMNGGVISGNTAMGGGGVNVSEGTFTLNGGDISGNTVLGLGGGVLLVDDGTFNMSDGAIFNNFAAGGGGVSVSGGTFTLNGGAISGNNARVDGGGINIMRGEFIMNGGDISGNSAFWGNEIYVLLTGNVTRSIDTTAGEE